MHKVNADITKKSGLKILVGENARAEVNVAFAVLFLVAVFVYTFFFQHAGTTGLFIVVAAVIGGYMALNIGANDVANNIGPAVGSKAITMTGAILIAMICEAAGALIAGGDVVSTIRKGIVDPAAMADQMTFLWAMMAALLSAALWLNLATFIGAPVSTTHSVVGGVVGAGIAAAGASSVAWGKMAAIAASWVVSPMLGGIFAALFLAFIKKNILFKEDKISAANTWVPVMVGIMAGTFSMYLVMKGLAKVWKADFPTLLLIGAAMGVLVWAITKPIVKRASAGLENRRKAVTGLFTVPLIGAAALLSFAHGANDVANAVGPLAAIVSVAQESSVDGGPVALPLWVMMIGATGISIGLALFGPKLIRTVGEKITRLNQARAFCIALSAAITVIAASGLGLPVSSTHIAVGGVFGVGFLREYMSYRQNRHRHRHEDVEIRIQRRRLVRRREALTIAAAWVITVPIAATLSATVFYVLTTVFE